MATGRWPSPAARVPGVVRGHEWWPPEILARLVPDERMRAVVTVEMPTLPREFYDELTRPDDVAETVIDLVSAVQRPRR